MAEADHGRELVVADEAEMLAVGARVADRLPAPATDRTLILTLAGDLGAGKTVLARGVLRACGHTGTVRSPTYTLVESYETPRRRIAHLDLYRLHDPDELDAIGYRDIVMAHQLVIIEWPSRAGALVGTADLAVDILHRPAGRLLRLTGALAARLA